VPDLSGPAGKIGRYFSVLSVIPSALLVSFVLVLAASGAWSGHVDWSAGFAALGHDGLTRVVQVALASLLVGLVLQPLQYALVQFAEGYWGTGPVAGALMRVCIGRHRRSRRNLNRIEGEYLNALESWGQSPQRTGDAKVTDDHLGALVRYEEARRALLGYPHDVNDVRPTRLGNMLRRYEAEAGAVYQLPLPVVAPHIALLAPKAHVDYVDDQRTQLDLAVRLALVSVLGAVAAVLFLWRDGLWLAVALVPYTMAYLFYLGAVVVAGEYGTALATVLDLNRFALYDALRVPQPASLGDERAQAAKLAQVLRTDLRLEDRVVALDYATPTAGVACDTGSLSGSAELGDPAATGDGDASQADGVAGPDAGDAS